MMFRVPTGRGITGMQMEFGVEHSRQRRSGNLIGSRRKSGNVGDSYKDFWECYRICIKSTSGVGLAGICWEAPVVHNPGLFALLPSVRCTFLLRDLAPLLSIFSLFPVVLKQTVYCVCSAEQPALRAAYRCVLVSVFVPASPSDHVNPLRGSAHLLPASLPHPFLFIYPPLAAIGLRSPLRHLIGSPVCRSHPTRVRASNPPVDLTGSDSNQAGTNYYDCLAQPTTSSHGALQHINV